MPGGTHTLHTPGGHLPKGICPAATLQAAGSPQKMAFVTAARVG